MDFWSAVKSGQEPNKNPTGFVSTSRSSRTAMAAIGSTLPAERFLQIDDLKVQVKALDAQQDEIEQQLVGLMSKYRAAEHSGLRVNRFRLVPGRAASYLCLTFGIATVCYTLAKYPAPYVSGYRTAAELTCSVAPADSVVMFSGLRDGSFIFNVRSLPQCKNLTVIRADKLLLKVAVDRQLFGVQEFGITEAHFKEMLERYGIRYIVIEPDFWSDLKSMQMLVGLVRQDQFKLLARIPIQSNRDKSHSQIEIYENLGPLSQGRNLLRVELPVSGISVEGSVGQQENR